MTYLEGQSGPEAEDDPGFATLWLQSLKAMAFGGEGVSEREREALRLVQAKQMLVAGKKGHLEAKAISPSRWLPTWLGGAGGEDTTSIRRADLELGLDRLQIKLAETAFQAAVASDAGLRVMPPAAEHLGVPPAVTLHTGSIFIDVADGQIDLRDPLAGTTVFLVRANGEWRAIQRAGGNLMDGPLPMEGAAAIRLQDTNARLYLPPAKEGGDFTVRIIQDGHAVTVTHPVAEAERARAGQPRVDEISRAEEVHTLEEELRAQGARGDIEFENLAGLSAWVAAQAGD